MKRQATPMTDTALRHQIRLMAEEAFHLRLISGYGDGEYPDKYQITYQGKTRHLELEEAFTFLATLITFHNSYPVVNP